MNYKPSAARDSGIQADARTGDRGRLLKLKASEVRGHLSSFDEGIIHSSLLSFSPRVVFQQYLSWWGDNYLRTVTGFF